MTHILKKYLVFIPVLLIAALYVTLLSSLSFIYEYSYPLDSAIFQIIGKGWTEGKIPYIDLWDQKGPFVYFVNALGYWLTSDKYGLFFIEIIIFAWSFLLLFQFYRKEFSKRISLLLLFVTICHLSQLIQGGNRIEEYILPLLILAFMEIWSWAQKATVNDIVEHSPKYAFLYGIILSLSMLSRLTNAIGICVCVLVIACYLMNKRQWYNLWQNSYAFIGGFLLMALPFWIYFYINNALYEMFYASILFNLDYAMNTYQEPSSLYALISTSLAYSNTYGLIIVSILLVFIDKQRRWFHLMWFAIALTTMFYFFNTFMYEHYAIIALPYFVIIAFELKVLFFSLKRLIYKRGAIILSALISLVFFANCLYQCHQSFCETEATEDDMKTIYGLPSIDYNYYKKKGLVGYNMHPSFYLYYDIIPNCRFFALQEWYASFSKAVRPMIIQSFEKTPSQYILTKRFNKRILIDGFLEKEYDDICDFPKGLTLYKKIDQKP